MRDSDLLTRSLQVVLLVNLKENRQRVPHVMVFMSILVIIRLQIYEKSGTKQLASAAVTCSALTMSIQ